MDRWIRAFVLGLLVASAGCTAERADTWNRYQRALERWYPIAWGSALPAESLSDDQRRFDCVWERVERPADEFACVIGTMDAMVRCSEDPAMRGKAVDCLKVERQPCSPSRAFRRASWECSSERDRPLVLPP